MGAGQEEMGERGSPLEANSERDNENATRRVQRELNAAETAASNFPISIHCGVRGHGFFFFGCARARAKEREHCAEALAHTQCTQGTQILAAARKASTRAAS